MISVHVNLKTKTETPPHSVRLCLNIHVSVRMLEDLRRPGEQQSSVVRNTTEFWWKLLDCSVLNVFFALYPFVYNSF